MLPMPPETGRQIVMKFLQYEIARATTADLLRAANFLEGAREIRRGCRKQRTKARKDQQTGWRKHVDNALLW
jgi:hypothetical protein